MDWKPYGACCLTAAADRDAVFCSDCRHPLLRCGAFTECGGLVEPTGHCGRCVAPALLISNDTPLKSKRGDRLSIPFVFRNASMAGRSLWVKRVLQWDGDATEPVALAFDKVGAGEERSFHVETEPLDASGQRTIRLMLVLATRVRGVEEAYAFKADVHIAVANQDTQQGNTYVQIGTGAMMHRVGEQAAAAAAPAGGPVSVTLERAERYELESGIRGDRAAGLRVPRDVPFTFEGFREGDRPAPQSTLVAEGRFSCGRSRRGPAAEPGGIVNDVCLRAFTRSGEIDEPATMAISRHHFDLVVVNDRLCVQAATTKGLQVAGQLVGAGEIVPLATGDQIVPIPDHPEKLTLRVLFTNVLDTVAKVTVVRTPAVAP
jgi:hypothetical protein